MERHKFCRKCGAYKPLSEFYRASGARDGRRNDCKTCSRAAKAARYRRDPAAEIARVRAWQVANRERHLANLRTRRQRPEVKARERDTYLRRTYGITLEQYDALLAGQGGGCAICRRPPGERISLHVDHDHATGDTRGILCVRCNNGLGLFDEDPGLFAAAVRYLTAG